MSQPATSIPASRRSLADLPPGVELRTLSVHADDRGELAEIYRNDWVPVHPFRQWNLVRSKAGILRGVHVHPRHSDYLHVVEGQLVLGLHDLRPADPAERVSVVLTLTGDNPATVFIPAGVCHGFWFPEPTVYVYGLSTGWSPQEEMGCSYNDPLLGLDWPAKDPVLSPRDRNPAQDYEGMRAQWLANQALAEEGA